MESKKCYTCKEILDVSKFSKNRTKKDGFSDRCKACVSNHRIQNKIKIRESRREHYWKNKERLDAYKKMWSQSNKDLIKKYSSKSYLKNKEKIREKARNNDNLKNVKRLWNARNREKLRACSSNSARRRAYELSDGYIRDLLTNHKSSLKAKDIPQELVDLKRVQVMITRKLKEIKSCNQPQSPT